MKTVRLEQNYRSTQMILEAAGAVVARNAQRKGKHLWTARQGGSKIGYYEAPDGENEALFIADQINKYLRKAGEESGSGELPRAAVLYRTNSQSRLVEEALRRYGIGYTMVGGFSFYDRSEIKDLLSYLKLVQNVDDSIALAAGGQYSAARHWQDHDGDDRAARSGNRVESVGGDWAGGEGWACLAASVSCAGELSPHHSGRAGDAGAGL